MTMIDAFPDSPSHGAPLAADAQTWESGTAPGLLPGEAPPSMGPGAGFTADSPAPRQNDDVIATQIDRIIRAREGMQRWAQMGKLCTEFLEGEQWSEADRKAMEDAGRPPITLNKIAPLHRYMMGNFLQNRYELRYLPGQDGTGIQPVAEALSHIAKTVDEMNGAKWHDGEAFSDGIVTGRAFYDYRLDFSQNIMGDIKERVLSPFSTLLDPEAEHYHPKEWSWVGYERWMSIQDIGHLFGSSVADVVYNSGVFGSSPIVGSEAFDEIAPERYFGQDQGFIREVGGRGGLPFGGGSERDYLHARRKLIMVTEVQHRMFRAGHYFVDLETGDRRRVPENFRREQIAKILAWSQEQGLPLDVMKSTQKEVRWTVTAGDRLLYDDWSPYRSFTIVPFFAYFRRGRTRGMIDDLIDPQREINKRRSVMLHIISTMANSGWMWEEGSLRVEEQQKLENHGAMPGLSLEYAKGKNPPRRLEPGAPPVAYERAENAAAADLKEISGLNDSALGLAEGKASSGRAIIARQKSAIVGAEPYFDNFSRTRQYKGEKILELIQDFYTEPRVIRTIGDDGDPIKTYINQQVGSRTLNNVTLGHYQVVVDEAPMSTTFMNAQFESAMEMVQAGIPIPPDVLIDLAPIPRKDEIKMRLAEQAQQGQQGAPMGQPNAPPAGRGQQGMNLAPEEVM